MVLWDQVNYGVKMLGILLNFDQANTLSPFNKNFDRSIRKLQQLNDLSNHPYRINIFLFRIFSLGILLGWGFPVYEKERWRNLPFAE